MKNSIKILVLLPLFLFYKIDAQQVVKKDTISGTELTMTMDPKVDELLSKMEDNCSRVSNNNSSGNVISTPRTTTTTPRINVPNRPMSNAEICRQNPRILGYKIQLVVVKSNEEANNVKAFFRNRFPNLKAEVDASLRPNYKVLAGSYFTRESASGDLSRIRQYFKSAIPVQYRVFCVEAK